MELCTKGLGSSVSQLKTRGVNLACVRTCVVVGEERPRINLTTSFSKLFSALGRFTYLYCPILVISADFFYLHNKSIYFRFESTSGVHLVRMQGKRGDLSSGSVESGTVHGLRGLESFTERQSQFSRTGQSAQSLPDGKRKTIAGSQSDYRES